MKQPAEWLPDGRSTLWFAADTGRLVEARDALAQPAARRGFNMLSRSMRRAWEDCPIGC